MNSLENDKQMMEEDLKHLDNVIKEIRKQKNLKSEDLFYHVDEYNNFRLCTTGFDGYYQSMGSSYKDVAEFVRAIYMIYDFLDMFGIGNSQEVEA